MSQISDLVPTPPNSTIAIDASQFERIINNFGEAGLDALTSGYDQIFLSDDARTEIDRSGLQDRNPDAFQVFEDWRARPDILTQPLWMQPVSGIKLAVLKESFDVRQALFAGRNYIEVTRS